MATQPTWGMHPIIHPDHHHALERRSAYLEFHEGLPRSQAEAQALDEYKKEQAGHAARHHATGMKLALSSNNSEAAKQHHEAYVRHMEALGLDPNDPPPEDGRPDVGNRGIYSFQPHGADQYIVKDEPKEEPIQKSEDLQKNIDWTPRHKGELFSARRAVHHGSYTFGPKQVKGRKVIHASYTSNDGKFASLGVHDSPETAKAAIDQHHAAMSNPEIYKAEDCTDAAKGLLYLAFAKILSSK